MNFLQIDIPPGDMQGYLLWNIGIFAGVITFLFLLLKANFELRLKEKDDLIKAYKEEIAQVRAENTALLNDLKPKMIEVNDLAATVIKLLQDEK